MVGCGRGEVGCIVFGWIFALPEVNGRMSKTFLKWGGFMFMYMLNLLRRKFRAEYSNVGPFDIGYDRMWNIDQWQAS